MTKKIGIFDSGVGGESVARAIKKALPQYELRLADDKEHLPYGTKIPDELFELVLPKLRQLQESGCQAIVIACNTVTTTIIDKLRAELSVPLVGMEPMIKPAAEQTKTGVIAVCATPATLSSPRYKDLKARYAKNKKVLEPDCSDWATMIEAKQINKQSITATTKAVCEQGADVIVLGCTHYHWIEGHMRSAAKHTAIVIQPEQPVISQLLRVLERQS